MVAGGCQLYPQWIGKQTEPPCPAYIFFFKEGSQVTQVDLELLTFLSLAPEHRSNRCVLPCLVSVVLGLNPGLIGKPLLTEPHLQPLYMFINPIRLTVEASAMLATVNFCLLV